MNSSDLTIGTKSSLAVTHCQICGASDLETVLFLGYLPPVNKMPVIGSIPQEQPSYPASLLRCPHCQLVQLGLIVDPKILFPPEYPYTSGTTRILRENFAELYEESKSLITLDAQDLIVDIGSNDGTLLSNFSDHHRVLGIEPTDRAHLAIERGIATKIAFFNQTVANQVLYEYGTAKIVTAANVFAHIEDIHTVTGAIESLLAPDGVFISESHYLGSLVKTVQYDTIYHEHLRYYSLLSLQNLLKRHGLDIFHAKEIPTHGGSIRVYAARNGTRQINSSVATIIEEEEKSLSVASFEDFRTQVVLSKLKLNHFLCDIKQNKERVYGISAPSRASTLINYVGLDESILDCVLEIKGSHKIGKYMPGTLIPVLDEDRLFEDPPDYALLLSWHIADELIPKLREKGFAGRFIIPLPMPHIVE